MARILLSPPPVARPVVRTLRTGTAELAAVWLFCLTMTLGPVLFLLALGQH